MLRVFRLVLICLSLFAVSCAKNQPGEAAAENAESVGYISVDGTRVVELKCGFEADMSPMLMGKNNWNLFAEPQEAGSVDMNKCKVGIQASPGNPSLRHVWIYGVSPYKQLYLELTSVSSTEYDVKDEFPQSSDSGKLGTAKVDTFVINTSATQLDLDIVLSLDKEIRIVFHGPTPNDGLNWIFDDPEVS
ncbi:MAG: hypothetical protein J5669_02540 [Bacteroidales bacterium]|nr:hypothetical protein [Bacteroidales bacterium]